MGVSPYAPSRIKVKTPSHRASSPLLEESEETPSLHVHAFPEENKVTKEVLGDDSLGGDAAPEPEQARGFAPSLGPAFNIRRNLRVE